MPISHDHKLIFLHCPKTGGTTIKNIFKINTLDTMCSHIYPSDSLALQHLTYKQLKSKMSPEYFDQYYKFTFVRNPWDKMVSEYFWCQRGIKTFTEFVYFVKDIQKMRY